MLLVSSIRALFGDSNKIVKALSPNVRTCRTNFESSVHKKLQTKLIANNSKSLLSISSFFSTISPQLNIIDGRTSQENLCIPLEHTMETDEYTLNVGRAIRTIRTELPLFFGNGLSDTSIYSPNILLTDPHHTRLHVRGKHIYLGIANLLRWSLIWYFDDLTLELIKLHTVENSIDEDRSDQDIYFKGVINDKFFTRMRGNIKKSKGQHKGSYFSTSVLPPSDRNTRLYIRWTLEGTPRSFYLISMFSSRGMRIPRSTFSGIFMYKFDPKSGLVLEHHVKHIIPAPSRKAVLYHGFGGFGGLLWRIRSSMTKQKNEWGMGLGMVGAKTHETENKLSHVRLKTKDKKNEFHDYRDVACL
ncbi:16073_t:CDS:2 [Funneliformis mosseae]|uniref:16073_t:CDS:1 n=1 Tax=Funneliformis mosseae TaxID=27381 RepID=A0A9N9F4A4_FUNMO|nr:16073_t:CDS:2 [Funneliformis mosseae]